MVSPTRILSKFPTCQINLGGQTAQHWVIYQEYDGTWCASADLQKAIGATILPHPNRRVLLSEIAHAHKRKVKGNDDA